MESKAVVKEIMKECNISQSELAEKSGFKSQSNITGFLNRGSASTNTLKVNVLVQLVEAMGFEVIVRDKRKNDKGERKEWRITDGIEKG